MTEREAIKILISSRDYLCDGNPTWRTEPIHDAVNMAVDALRKTKNSSEKPNNCDTCKHNKLEWYSEVCDGCSKAHSNYEPKDEPQTERSE